MWQRGEIDDYFGLHHSIVSRTVEKAKARPDPGLRWKKMGVFNIKYLHSKSRGIYYPLKVKRGLNLATGLTILF